MNNPPAISVVIAAFNAQTTLEAQLRALESQRPGVGWELLVCDNGSTDGTADLVRRAAERMPNLRLLDASARRGPGAARNVGARAARAPLLAFCDADDVVGEDWLASMVETLGAETFVTGRSRRPEFNSRPGDPHSFDWGIYRVPFFPYLPAAGAGNMGVHRTAFLAVGGFDEGLSAGEDLDLCWRMQLAGHRLVEDPRAVVFVSNRQGLTATITQSFAYGTGDRRLLYKYALVGAAFRREGPVPPADAPAAEQPGVPGGAGRDAEAGEPPRGTNADSFAARAWRKMRSLRRLSDLTNAAHRAGAWAGFRFGRVDRSVPQVAPPRELPPTWSG